MAALTLKHWIASLELLIDPNIKAIKNRSVKNISLAKYEGKNAIEYRNQGLYWNTKGHGLKNLWNEPK